MKHSGGTKVLALALALLLSGAGFAARAQEAAGAGARPAGDASKDSELTRILDGVAEGVKRYQTGLFRIAFTETLRREELREDMTPKRSREFVFETVVLREPLSEDEEDFYPHAVRRLKTLDGKPAKPGSKAEREARAGVASLSFLLPQHRARYVFTLEGEETIGGRRARRIRMLQPSEGEPRVEWERGFVGLSFRVFAPFVYLIWVDAETFDVLRYESHLAAPMEFDSPRAFGRFGPSRHLRYAAQDYAVRFRRVQFKDPEQTLLVPDWAEWLTVIEGARQPRRRDTLRLSDYRRFRSDVNVVEEPEG
jgi:hypothetical protein